MIDQSNLSHVPIGLLYQAKNSLQQIEWIPPFLSQNNFNPKLTEVGTRFIQMNGNTGALLPDILQVANTF